MAETEWNDEEAAPTKKKGVPTWVWIGCGSGCLLALIVVAVLAFFTVRTVNELKDPEQAWEKVAEVMPFDERPEGWEARGTSVFGTGNIFLQPPGSDAVIVLQYFGSRREVEDLFDPESTANNLMFMKLEDPEAGEIELQGRTTRTLRFIAPAPRSEVKAPSIRIDLSGEGSRGVYVQIVQEGEEPVADELVRELLAPFDVWRGK